MSRKPSKALRLGRVRDGEHGRGWQLKLYAPTARYRYHRLAYKEDGKWVDVAVRDQDPDDAFDELEARLTEGVKQSRAKQVDAPTMAVLVGRYLDWLCDSDPNYIAKVRNLLDVWVLKTHSDLLVSHWSPTHSKGWISAARNAGLSAARVEDLGVALAGLRSTAQRKDENGKRLLSKDDDPLEGVQFSRTSRMEGADRNYVPVSDRPTTAHLRDLIDRATVAEDVWEWMPLQLGVGGSAGPRLSEQFALRAYDVDLVARSFTFRSSVQWPRPKDGIKWGIKPRGRLRGRAGCGCRG